jgi:putative endonuclease
MVEQEPSKLNTRVRFPSPAPSASAKASAGLFRDGGGIISRWRCKLFGAGGGCHAVALAKADSLTNDPARRLDEHNGGKSVHTNKYRPWKLMVSIGFADAAKAVAFERYLKSGSGRAFAKKHF